jgi:catechol 2,3-dioxygenase-like lactoylglutathione lyase family enzyme
MMKRRNRVGGTGEFRAEPSGTGYSLILFQEMHECIDFIVTISVGAYFATGEKQTRSEQSPSPNLPKPWRKWMRLRGLNHILLAMPKGQEQKARAFYSGLLGIPEVRKPANLAARGGCWFEAGQLRVHLGVDPHFVPARKAHPAFIVEGLTELIEILRQAGCEVTEDEPLEGYNRKYVYDPFGNRIELMEPSFT